MDPCHSSCRSMPEHVVIARHGNVEVMKWFDNWDDVISLRNIKRSHAARGTFVLCF